MTQARNDICSIIREAEDDTVLISRHGKPAAVVIGFRDEDDWFDYRLQHDEQFLSRINLARQEIRKGQYVRLEDLPD